jgi:hypothetical protein
MERMPHLSFTLRGSRGTALVTAAVVGCIALVPSAHAGSRTALTRLSLSRISTAATNGQTYSVGGFIAVPASWSPHRTASTISLRDRDYPSCLYTITITAQAVQSPAGTPAEQIGAQQNVDPKYVIDSGTRGRGAWRVVRQPGGASKGITVIGDLLLPYAPGQGPGDGPTTWVGLHAVASAKAGSVCHSGMYRQALGPQMGDAFASYRGFVRAGPG